LWKEDYLETYEKIFLYKFLVWSLPQKREELLYRAVNSNWEIKLAWNLHDIRWVEFEVWAVLLPNRQGTGEGRQAPNPNSKQNERR